MVRQHPGRGRADLAQVAGRDVDGLAQRRRVPRRDEVVEVERGVQPARRHVPGEPLRRRRPGLGDEHAVAGVGVGHPPPRLVDLQHPVAVDERVPARAVAAPEQVVGVAEVGQRRVLDQPVRDVDAEPVDAPVEPEPQDRLELGGDVRVRPVQVGLAGVEQVEVPGAGRRRLDPRPRRPAEVRAPVVGRLGAVGARPRPEDVAVARAGLVGERRPEPRVLVGRVVRDDVGDQPQPVLVGVDDQLLGVGDAAVGRVDRPVVGDVVARVGLRRGVPGVDPQRVDAEVGEVRQLLADARDVTDPVAVRVGEAADVDLVDDGVAPPGRVGHGRLPGRSWGTAPPTMPDEPGLRRGPWRAPRSRRPRTRPRTRRRPRPRGPRGPPAR